jgi:phage terminase large subunit-like protein
LKSQKSQPKKDSQRSGSTREIPGRWPDLFKLIPGYDPVISAGDCWFDADAADKAIRFFTEYLSHVEGELSGQPLDLAPWQQAIIGCVFGWKRPDGLRRYREIFQYVPRKNGKTCLLGGIINLMGFIEGEPGSQLFSAAADKEQAGIVYKNAREMIANCPELAAEAKIYASLKSIKYPDAVFRALSKEAPTKHGLNPQLIIVDELHAQPNRELVDVLTSAVGARRQPLIWFITTADFDRPSICNEKLEYARKVRDNRGDPEKPGFDASFLPVIYEALPEDDWQDPAVWQRVNPNYGISLKPDFVEREYRRAKDTPSYENTFKRLQLNMRTQTDVRWLSLLDWDKCGGAIDEESLVGRPCFGAMDMSTKLDITAFGLVFPPHGDDLLWRILCKFWAPKINAEKRQKVDKVPYITWADQGYIELTPESWIDFAIVEARVFAMCERFKPTDVAYDSWNAEQMAQQLRERGVTMVQFNQGYKSMSEPAKELEKLVIAKAIAHGGNPVLRWMAGNATIETDAPGNIKPSKAKSTGRIDGIIATVMGIGRGLVAPTNPLANWDGKLL